jgi:hypothetical protein
VYAFTKLANYLNLNFSFKTLKIMKRVYFLIALSLFLFSCNKEHNSIDLSVLHSHDFIDCNVNEFPNNIYTPNNDTVRLSFEKKDTLKLYYYNYGNGKVLTKVDTGYMKYGVLNGNEIAFGWFIDMPQGINYGLSLHWYIQVLNPDTIILNSYSNTGELTGHWGYKPILK